MQITSTPIQQDKTWHITELYMLETH